MIRNHNVDEIIMDTGGRFSGNGFVLPVLPVQEQSKAVPRSVCFVSVLYRAFAAAGRSHGRNQLCTEYSPFSLPEQHELQTTEQDPQNPWKNLQ